MLSKEDFEGVMTTLREKLDDTTNALISDDLLNIMSVYTNAVDEVKAINDENDKLKNEKDELLKVNGKLYQRIGFDKVEEEKEDNKEDSEEEFTINDIINEKGEII